MRIMLDTNVLVSAALYPNSKPALAVLRATQKHSLLICSYVMEELNSVFARKFPHKTKQLEVFLSKLSYELCDTPDINHNTPEMRDADDRPILQAAIDADVDVILTGDDDFHSLSLERPQIISPTEFLKD